jgi:hypothetical protein
LTLNVSIYFIILILIFSPKFGFIDLKLITIPLIIFFQGYTKISLIKPLYTFSFFCIFLGIYSLFIFLINDNNYIDSPRYLRALLSVLLVATLYSYKYFTYKILLYTISIVLFTHVLISWLMILFPELQPIIYSFNGYNKDLKLLRVSGLVAGFDIAGNLALILSFISFHARKIYNYNFFSFILFFSFFSIFFTSRTNSLLAIILAIYFLYSYVSKEKIKFKTFIFLILFLGIFSSLLYLYVVPLLLQSLILNIGFEMSNNIDIYDAGYSKNNPLELLKSFIILPENLNSIIFGSSYNPGDSDSGYIKIINIIGIFGLIITVISYLIVIPSINNIIFSFKKNVHFNFLKKVIVFILLMTLLISIKNQLFYTRGIFEVYIFFIMLFYKFKKEFKNKKC